MTQSAVVVGAGIIGSSIAFHLQSRGLAVTLIDSDPDSPLEASRASFAWMNARDKNPRSYHDLNRRSLEMWPRFGERLQADIRLTWGGDIRWSDSPEDAAESRERVKVLQSWGYHVRDIDLAEAERLALGVNFQGFLSGSFSECDGHVDAIATVNALRSRGQERGMALKLGESVEAFDVQDGIRSVQTDSASYPCDVCVIAGGAASSRLLSQVGIELPMYDTFGATVVTSPVSRIFEGPCVMHGPKTAEIPLAVRQFEDGTVILHGGKHGQMHDESLGQNADEADLILRQAAEIVPGISLAEIREVRSARRPIPEDGQSVLGFTQKFPNLYLAVTHSGVTLAPLIGQMATTEIVDGQLVDILEPFRPSRFRELS